MSVREILASCEQLSVSERCLILSQLAIGALEDPSRMEIDAITVDNPNAMPDPGPGPKKPVRKDALDRDRIVSTCLYTNQPLDFLITSTANDPHLDSQDPWSPRYSSRWLYSCL